MLAQLSQVRPVKWPVIRRVDGDLFIHGDLNNQQLIISGNLYVEGVIEHCQLRVGGHLKAAGILNSRLEVEGRLEASYLRSCQFLVEGDLCVTGETAFSQGEVQGLALPGWVVESRVFSAQHLLAKGVITNRQGGTVLWAGFGTATPQPEQPAMVVVLERLDAGTRIQVHQEGITLRQAFPESAFCLIQQQLTRLPVPADRESSATPAPESPAP